MIDHSRPFYSYEYEQTPQTIEGLTAKVNELTIIVKNLCQRLSDNSLPYDYNRLKYTSRD